jgi:hypothetical protein
MLFNHCLRAPLTKSFIRIPYANHKHVEKWLKAAKQTQFLAKKMQLIVNAFPSPLIFMPTNSIPQILRHSNWEALTQVFTY